jgi:glycosyltransferase involved in cell wall biosynthesis
LQHETNTGDFLDRMCNPVLTDRRADARPIREAPVAFFLPSLAGGGAERVVVNLVRGMVDRGRFVDVILAAAEGPLLAELPAAARVLDLGGLRVLRSLRPLADYLRRERPSALISSMSHANLVALWAARLAGTNTPVVVTVHNTLSQTRWAGGLVAALQPMLLRWFYPWAAHVVAVSQGAADDLVRTSGLSRATVRVIYNPVITPAMLSLARRPADHPWLAPGTGAPPVILGAGRLTRQKDFPTLLRALAAVRARRECRLIILGEGEERPGLEALAAELGVRDSVDLPGFRENAVSHMAASAVFVLSSAWEGLPTVLIEALATGTRVISTDCPSGPREILDGGRLGRLVPVGDPAALAEAIVEALDQPHEPASLDELATFTADAAVDNYLSLIDA